MIKVNANIFKTNGVIIPEEVYIRTIQSCGVGQTVEKQALDDQGNPVVDDQGNPVMEKYLVYNIQAVAWLKSVYESLDDNGEMLKYNAPNIPIDELTYELYVEIPVNMDISAYTKFGDLFKVFNEAYMKELEKQGVVTANDYIIIDSV